MDAGLASKFAHPREARHFGENALQSELTTRGTALPVSWRASLLLIVVLSLGLWAAIWAAAAWLLSALLNQPEF
jgi:hypothetical protein